MKVCVLKQGRGRGTHRGRVQRRGPWRQRVNLQAAPLPEDKVSTVDLLPAATVLQDASVAHHSTLLKLRSVVGHFLERTMHGVTASATPPLHFCIAPPKKSCL